MRRPAEAAPFEGGLGLPSLPPPTLAAFLDLPADRSASAAARSADALPPRAAALFAYSDLGTVDRGLPANALSASAGSATSPTPAKTRKSAQPAEDSRAAK